jgi:HEPN domain-containing protein
MKESWFMTPGIDKEAEILLAKAAEDETAAQLTGIPDGPFGFHIQQAVEKLLKALLCQCAVKYKFTHDLEYLVKLLRDNGEAIPKSAVDITELESYGVAYRYDAVPEVAVLDRAVAIEAVRIIRQHVVARISALSGTP